MYKQSTTSNECSDQISAENDRLMESYGTADRDPKCGDINFLPSDGSPHLPSPFLRHFIVDPGPLGLVLILRCWAYLCNTTRGQWAELPFLMHAGKHDCFFGTSMLATVVVHDTAMLSVWNLAQDFLLSNPLF
jgi:hypothetical protein